MIDIFEHIEVSSDKGRFQNAGGGYDFDLKNTKVDAVSPITKPMSTRLEKSL